MLLSQWSLPWLHGCDLGLLLLLLLVLLVLVLLLLLRLLGNANGLGLALLRSEGRHHLAHKHGCGDHDCPTCHLPCHELGEQLRTSRKPVRARKGTQK